MVLAAVRTTGRGDKTMDVVHSGGGSNMTWTKLAAATLHLYTLYGDQQGEMERRTGGAEGKGRKFFGLMRWWNGAQHMCTRSHNSCTGSVSLTTTCAHVVPSPLLR